LGRRHRLYTGVIGQPLTAGGRGQGGRGLDRSRRVAGTAIVAAPQAATGVRDTADACRGETGLAAQGVPPARFGAASSGAAHRENGAGSGYEYVYRYIYIYRSARTHLFRLSTCYRYTERSVRYAEGRCADAARRRCLILFFFLVRSRLGIHGETFTHA
jgi:hypothetical protein